MTDVVDPAQEELGGPDDVAGNVQIQDLAQAMGRIQRRVEPPKLTMLQQYEQWQKRLEDQLEGIKKVVAFLKDHPEVNELNALLEDVDRRGRK